MLCKSAFAAIMAFFIGLLSACADEPPALPVSADLWPQQMLLLRAKASTVTPIVNPDGSALAMGIYHGKKGESLGLNWRTDPRGSLWEIVLYDIGTDYSTRCVYDGKGRRMETSHNSIYTVNVSTGGSDEACRRLVWKIAEAKT